MKRKIEMRFIGRDAENIECIPGQQNQVHVLRDSLQMPAGLDYMTVRMEDDVLYGKIDFDSAHKQGRLTFFQDEEMCEGTKWLEFGGHYRLMSLSREKPEGYRGPFLDVLAVSKSQADAAKGISSAKKFIESTYETTLNNRYNISLSALHENSFVRRSVMSGRAAAKYTKICGCGGDEINVVLKTDGKKTVFSTDMCRAEAPLPPEPCDVSIINGARDCSHLDVIEQGIGGSMVFFVVKPETIERTGVDAVKKFLKKSTDVCILDRESMGKISGYETSCRSDFFNAARNIYTGLKEGNTRLLYIIDPENGACLFSDRGMHLHIGGMKEREISGFFGDSYMPALDGECLLDAFPAYLALLLSEKRPSEKALVYAYAAAHMDACGFDKTGWFDIVRFMTENPKPLYHYNGSEFRAIYM